MKKDLYLGAAYYPELWEEEEIEKDIARIREVGLNCVRIGEFAWGRMESQESVFDFEWLKRAVEKLYEKGIYTVLCTPSATPPRWLLNKYPETRMVMHDLVRADVSSRCHTCKTSPVMREKNRIIVTKMAETFAGRPGVIGWQIDNEIFPYNEGCFCENCKAAFRMWLKEKFGTIENLNKAWGMARWSLTYDSFADIEPPYPRQWRHPSLRKAWHDFQCAQIKSYVDEQADILHNHGCKNVGTDMMRGNLLSYSAVNEKLDVPMFNHYESAKDLADAAFAYDFLRCVKDKPFWVTETQANWNGGEFAEGGYRPEGACYAATMLTFAKGAEMNLYWLFRTHPNGHELAHGGIFSPSGREYRVAEEVKRAARDVRLCGGFLSGTNIESKIALHYSNTAAENFMCAPLVKGFDYRCTLVWRIYMALRHYNVDVIDTRHGLEGYKVLLSPFLATADENGFRERVTEWVKSGGTWIVGPISDIMDGNVRRYTDSVFGFLEELAGVYVKYQRPIGNDVFRAGWENDGECGISVWYDAFECKEGTKSLAHYTAGEFAPYSVITERNVGKGRVILVGSVLSHDDILRLVALPPIAEASENVTLTQRTGKESGMIAVETAGRSGRLFLESTHTDLLTGRALCGNIELAPYEVLVLRK